MRRYFFLTLAVTSTLIVVLGIYPIHRSVQAQAGSAYDIIDAVNAVRTSHGNPALEVDSILMATAQGTAETMANSGSCAHIGNTSGRVAAAGYGGGAQVWATENIACGMDLSVQTTVYSYWSDAAHMLPMTNASYTHVGAGVAIVGGKVYYVLHAAYTSGGAPAASTPGSKTAAIAAAYPTAQIIQPVITSTPNPDGQVIHEVQAGQALWSIAIAYGVKIDDILTLNQLPANPILTIGQKLLIAQGPTATVSATITLTTRPPTRTPTRTPTPRPPTATATSTPTPTPTPRVLIEKPAWLDNQAMGIGLVIISAAGLFALMLTAMRKK